MENHRAVPDGYMKVGELAKKAGVTVRTLQYYDKEGLLPPSAESEGGFRLYTDKDLVKLVQILMMKQLGFSLGGIKKRIAAMDTTEEVLDALSGHAANIRKEIEHLTGSLCAIESLAEEIVQVDSVDYRKYADILTHLQMKNKRYWLVKYFDSDVLDTLMANNEAWGEENAARLVEDANSFIDEAARLQGGGVSPESEQAKDFAEKYWKWIMEVTGGDMGMIQRIVEQTTKSESDEKHDEVMEKALLFMKSSLAMYFSNGFIAEAARLHDDGVAPESGKGQEFADRYWKWLMEITGGDMAKLQEMNEQFGKSGPGGDETSEKAKQYMEASLQSYFSQGAK